MRLLRVRDAAEKYGLSRSTLYKWRCYGAFPQMFRKLGRVVFVDEVELRRISKGIKEI
jgi:predicted DNA-binding transcriptional regulator AlpA